MLGQTPYDDENLTETLINRVEKGKVDATCEKLPFENISNNIVLTSKTPN